MRAIAGLHFGVLLPTSRNVKINSDKQHMIFALELGSALRLMMGLLNTDCELLQICHLNIKLKLNSFCVTIYNAFVFFFIISDQKDYNRSLS
jgi:hypothetical protein